MLAEIADHVRTWHRRQMVEDFSLTQLIGAVAQLVAIGAAFWALIGTISPGEYSLPATRWLAAIFCQLLALTFFLLHRQR